MRGNRGSAPARHLVELSRDLVGYGSIVALSHAIGLVQLPLLTRALAVAQFGAYDVLATLVTLAALLLRLSLPEALARYFRRSTESELRSLTSSLLVLVTLAGGLACAVVWPLLPGISRLLFAGPGYTGMLQLVCLIGWLQSIASIPKMRLRLERRLRAFATVEVGRQVLFLGLVGWLVVRREGEVGAVFVALLISEGAVLLLSLLWIRRDLEPRVSLAALRPALRFGLPLVPGRLLGWIGNQVPRFMLLALAGLGGVAVYGVGMRLAHVALGAGVVFESAWQPYAMLLIESEERNRVYRAALTFFVAAVGGLGIVVTAAAPEILRLLAPGDYAQATTLLPLLFGGMALRQSVMFTRLGILASEKTYAQTIAQALVLAATLLSSGLLVWFLGALGAALAFFLSSLTLTVTLGWISARVADLRFDRRAIGGVLLIYVATSVGVVWVARVLPAPASAVVRGALALVAVASIASLVQARRAIHSAITSLTANRRGSSSPPRRTARTGSTSERDPAP